MKKIFSSIILICLIICIAAPTVSARDYPKRPVTIICPYGVGGGTDIMCRQIAKHLEAKFKVPFPVVNIPGSSGGVALADAMSKQADGYTIVGFTTGMYQLGQEDKVPYKLGRDYVSLSMLNVLGAQFYSYPKAPWKDGKEFMAYVKKNPRKVTVAVAEVMSNDGQALGHLALDGYELKPVVYTKAGERLSSVMGGHNLVTMTRYGNVKDHLKSGMLVPTLSLSNVRNPMLPETMCLADVGITGWTDAQCNYQGRGLALKKGVPQERVKMLADAIAEIVKTKEWRDYMESKGMAVEDSHPTPESMDKYLSGYTITEEYGKVAMGLLN